MNPRLTAPAAFCREVALPALVLACIAAPGFAGIDTSKTAPIVERIAKSVPANASFADKLPPSAIRSTKADSADVATLSKPAAQPAAVVEPMTQAVAAVEPVMQTAAIDTPVAQTAATEQPPSSPPAPQPVVVASLGDPADIRMPEAAQPPETAANMAAREPDDLSRYAAPGETPAACSEPNCIDHYLWSLYQQTPKEDSVRVDEKKQVTVKRKGKMVTVTRTVGRVTDEDFAWKDSKAADKAGMQMPDYVIGGMDQDFKLRLFKMLRAAEAEGLAPGITSAFRDDYRQSIASGLKAADNRSYHGGSLHGGYGHGLAADIVSIGGATRTERLASSQALWKWVDTHGKDFGIGRPYLSRDPPHVAPTDGQEWATHRGAPKIRQAGTASKPGKKIALGNERNPAKHVRTARSS